MNDIGGIRSCNSKIRDSYQMIKLFKDDFFGVYKDNEGRNFYGDNVAFANVNKLSQYKEAKVAKTVSTFDPNKKNNAKLEGVGMHIDEQGNSYFGREEDYNAYKNLMERLKEKNKTTEKFDKENMGQDIC